MTSSAWARYAPLTAWLALAATGCVSFPLSSLTPVETGYVKHEYRSLITGQNRRYAAYVPRAYNDSSSRWPLIVYLHGAGERGDDIDQVIVHGPIKVGLMRPDFPFLVVAPQCPSTLATSVGGAWATMELDLNRILDEVQSRYRVDADRVYLTGLNMGGYGAFHYGLKQPEKWAAVAPISGGGDPVTIRSRTESRPPFWIFHGQLDTVVRPTQSVEMHGALQALGWDSRLTLYPDRGHDAWTVTYDGEELYDWFLDHRRMRPDESMERGESNDAKDLR